MKVEAKQDCYKNFGELAPGDVFWMAGALAIKIRDMAPGIYVVYANLIILSDGSHGYLGKDEKVIPAKVKIVNE